ncbi:MAG: TetR/AcrR family transcriptional regulator [Anaerolineae bacterium]|nr:TetR/AcrR family transcriptional regulator [Anaerolineae bacterium]
MSEQVLSLRERKKQETRQRILDVAVDLFQNQGFDQTSVDEIADRAGISRGTCFNYFANKESILCEIAVRELEHLQHLAENGPKASPVATIRRVMHALVADTLPYLRVTRYVFLGAMLYPSDETAFHIRLGSILGKLVQKAQAQGEIRADLPPAEVVRAITGTYLAVIYDYIAHSQATSDGSTSVERIINMIFEGIAGPDYANPT